MLSRIFAQVVWRVSTQYLLSERKLLLGLMLCIKTLSQRQSCVSVSVSVSMFEDEKPRDRPLRVFIIWQVDWVLAIPSCFVSHLLLPACCHCVLNCSRLLCVGKFWRAFHRKLAVYVQGRLCSISKLLCRAVYDLSFPMFFVISFRCCWVEFPGRDRSRLLAQGNNTCSL